MRKSWKTRVSGYNSVAAKITWKFSRTLGLSFLSCLEVKSFHLPNPTHLYISESGLLWITNRKLLMMNWNDIWHVPFFFVLKYLCNPPLNVPWICSNLVNFKVYMTLSVQLGLDTQWILYSNLRRIWIILINLCHF